jgi:hypothetical protein
MRHGNEALQESKMNARSDRDFKRLQRCAEQAFALGRVTHALLLGNLAAKLLSDRGASDIECETIGELAARYEFGARSGSFAH